MFRAVGSISRIHFTHARRPTEFSIFFEIRLILFPHTLLWGIINNAGSPTVQSGADYVSTTI